jgi:hypothetical protein
VPTLLEAWKEFNSVRMPDIKPVKLADRYRQAKAHFLFDVGNRFGDMPLTAKGLQKRIVEMRKHCKLADEPKQKMMYKLRAIVQYFVDERWIDENVVNTIGIRKVDRYREVVIFTPNEVAAMEEWYRSHGQAWHAHMVAFISRTGLRLG